ncbi:MAG: sulfite exporter TauE/SafE family protein [Clostridia bacterium]|nr:sulfite exporter TauE/SafE family protein [Clostridia bacterium]
MFSIKLLLSGLGIGIINSLFGAGGGIIAVPVLKNDGLTQKSAQASAIAVILPLSIISMFIYLSKGYFSLTDGIRYLPFGFIGAVTGTKIMDKISNRLLSLIFSFLLIYSGIRMILK